MPDKVHECVQSVLDDNPEMSEQRAWAICQSEIDVEAAEVDTLDGLDLEAEAFDEFAAETDEWAAVDGGWVNADEQLAVCNVDALAVTGGLPDECRKCGETPRQEGSMVCADCDSDPDQQASTVDAVSLAFPPGGEVIDHEEGDWDAFLDDLSQHGDVFQMWKGLQRHPEDDLESHDHATFVALQADSDITDVEAVLKDHPAVHYKIRPSTVDAFDRPDGWQPESSEYSLSPDQQLAQQAVSEFSADVFRIVQAEDDDMDLDSDVMGVGVAFPNSGVYVDWNNEAWPEDEQLDDPHVSDYGSIEDLEQATGNVVEPLVTVDAVAGGVVDGEGSAAPTDTERSNDDT